jgi:hypothetical protein
VLLLLTTTTTTTTTTTFMHSVFWCAEEGECVCCAAVTVSVRITERCADRSVIITIAERLLRAVTQRYVMSCARSTPTRR